MDYRCSIYGLGIVTNRIIPGVPASTIASEDLRITFGSLPARLHELSAAPAEACYVADYQSECGEPALRVFRLLDGEYYRFDYADQTRFLINRSGSEPKSMRRSSDAMGEAGTPGIMLLVTIPRP